jgi:hypothetical protein
MNGLAHLLDNTVHPLQPFIVLAALIVWIVAAIQLVRNRMKTFPEKLPRGFVAAGMVFLGIVGAEFALVAFVKYEALREIDPQLSGAIDSVTVNGTPIANVGPLVDALRKMHGTIGHHSHPTTRYHVVLITSRGSLPLDLERDSGDPHEYWVYYPVFHITRLNEVGHAFTDALDGILGSQVTPDLPVGRTLSKLASVSRAL